MTLPDDKAIQLERAIMEVIARARLHGCCLSCVHFTEATEGCAMAEGARPPARVIVEGCPKYMETPPF